MSPDPSSTTESILNLLTSHGQSDYIGERISQLEHCLQCAHLAESAQANPETIIAALLHDIGQFLPAKEVQRLAGEVRNMNATVDDSNHGAPGPTSASVGRAGHESIGAQYLRELNFSEKVCALVGSHVDAKRYLCAIDPLYHATLSEASKKSLEFQGGPMTGHELEEWGSSDLCSEMVQLRRWDDAAKVVGLKTGTVDRYRATIEHHLVGRAI